MESMSEVTATVLADETVCVMLLPDETLTEAFIMIRKLIESGTEVLAATPNAMELFMRETTEAGCGYPGCDIAPAPGWKVCPEHLPWAYQKARAEEG